MKILVTGGLGFIGSHTVVALLEKNYEVVIVDNLSNTSIDVLEGITRITGKTPDFHQIDIRNKSELIQFFDNTPDISGIIHFAAFKAVGESVEKPLDYYENNVSALVYLLKESRKLKQPKFIFSSSCTVYGQAETLPITENAPVQKANSPYGNTKQIDEEIIQDYIRSGGDLEAISLRYFNPIGAHPSALIGELPIGVPQNLVPYVTQTAAGKRQELSVFGDDYPTKDGTCIRDYIHVMDLADIHAIALEKLMKKDNSQKYDVFNVGTGKGNSVLDVVNTFEKVNDVKLPYKIVDRRPGDVTAAYADTTKVEKELKWKAKRSMGEALKDAWRWEQKQHKSQ
ncbi:UDP-glucose 4-epimerase GalE [Mesohalobacter halotolerans]|uniref:UDP-glucose 4-epimerase n=1 Tax=Mesohalobacter halotolerans TaxID=1883405 RepID=A0A4U5TNJ3_9FLAO|nr:UDP-glucose 4-epimerase GalE [Mesohalobacter halotolerans]MBS3738830.1 UDP-glucose 4-epimerase GalE [Psychroflexus sp.]TKS55540.1 UDP-glucose 4-epimerase GalE [Mesohalobacter halotolerans]